MPTSIDAKTERQRKPRRHHYVPQCLLRQFSDSSERLYFFRKDWPAGKVKSTKPANIFQQRDTYTYIEKDGELNTTLESEFSALEGKFASLHPRLIESATENTLGSISKDDLRLLHTFLYFQIKRVPEFFELHGTIDLGSDPLEVIKQKFSEIGRTLTAEEEETFKRPGEIERIQQKALVQSLATSSDEIIDEFGKMSICALYINKPSTAFVIGSNPVLKLSRADPPRLSHPTTEYWLPLSSKVAIWMGHSSTPFSRPACKEEVRELNLMTAKHSVTIAGCSKELILSLSSPR